jgi:alkaline phosphatase D
VLSGDVHVSLLLELEPNPFDADKAPIAIEFVTPSLTSQNLDDKMGWKRRTQSVPIEQHAMQVMPHWHWCDLDSHGYVVIDVTPERVRGQWWHVDTVLEPSADEELAATYDVNHGSLQVMQVV